MSLSITLLTPGPRPEWRPAVLRPLAATMGLGHAARPQVRPAQPATLRRALPSVALRRSSLVGVTQQSRPLYRAACREPLRCRCAPYSSKRNTVDRRHVAVNWSSRPATADSRWTQ